MSGISTMRFALFIIAISALSACASGTNRPVSTDAPRVIDGRAGQGSTVCPDINRLGARALYGAWVVELPEAGLRGTLLLKAHPEFSESLRGEFRLGGQDSIASGDVEGGELNLDESRDGKTLHAFWSGRLVPAACGREIRGTWQPVPQEGKPAGAESSFVLRRAAASRW